MKEKLKLFLLYGFILYSSVIVILLLVKYFSYNKFVYFSNIDSITKTVSKSEEKLKNLNQNECTDMVKQYIDYYRITTFNGEILFKDLAKTYDNNAFDLKLYSACKIYMNEDDRDKLSRSLLTHLTSLSVIYSQHVYSYELYIGDYYLHDVELFGNDDVIYHIIKNTESDAISIIVDSLEKGSVINE